MAYFYILLSAACCVLIAHLLKVTEVKELRTLPTLTINYLSAGLFAFGIGMWSEGNLSQILNQWMLIFCLVVGALFIGNFFMYSKSVDANGVGVTITTMRVSLLVPVLTSIYLYEEIISFKTAAGIRDEYRFIAYSNL